MIKFQYKPKYLTADDVYKIAKYWGLEDLYADGFGDAFQDFAFSIEQFVLEQIEFEEDYWLDVPRAVEKE
jgi:hypothetical protein